MTLRRTLTVIKPEMVDAKDVVTSLGAKFEKVDSKAATDLSLTVV